MERILWQDDHDRGTALRIYVMSPTVAKVHLLYTHIITYEKEMLCTWQKL